MTLTPDFAAYLVALSYIVNARRRDEDGNLYPSTSGVIGDRVDHLLALAEIDLDAPDLFLAVVTGRGEKSSVPDDPGAVDADVWCCGAMVGKVTLKPSRDQRDDGALVPWGDPEHWASDDLLVWMGPALYTDEPNSLPGRIVQAVREAVKRAETAPAGMSVLGALASALAERVED